MAQTLPFFPSHVSVLVRNFPLKKYKKYIAVSHGIVGQLNPHSFESVKGKAPVLTEAV
jgi:hypothetical protein